MPYVCTGKLVADGKQYAYGETVPTAATWAPHHLTSLMRSGAVRLVSNREAEVFAGQVAKQLAVDKLRSLTRAHKAAQHEAVALASEAKATESQLVALRGKLSAAQANELKAREELAAFSRANPSPVEEVKADELPRVVPVGVTPPEPPVMSEARERELLLSTVFGKSRGDLIAYAAKKPSEGGPAEGPFDLSKLAKEKKEVVAAAFADAVMAVRKAPKSAQEKPIDQPKAHKKGA